MSLPSDLDTMNKFGLNADDFRVLPLQVYIFLDVHLFNFNHIYFSSTQEQHYSVDTLTPETLETFDETVENIDFSFTEILLNFFNLIDRSSKEKQFSKISGIVSRYVVDSFYSIHLL